jgi:hypothetical protein
MGVIAAQPEVDEHGATGRAEENIAGFDIVVCDAVLVDESKSRSYIVQDTEGVGGGAREVVVGPTPGPVCERRRSDVLEVEAMQTSI